MRRVYKNIVLGFALLVSPSMAVGQSYPGYTEPVFDALLSAAVPGTIKNIRVKQGDSVEEGAVLVELDDRLESLEVDRRKLIWQSKIEVNAAKLRTELLQRDFSATKELFETTKSVSREEMETKELEYQLALAEYQRLEKIEEREELEYRIASEQLNLKQIRAPGAGIITDVLLDEGENCEQRQPVMRFVNVSKGYFKCNMNAADAGDLTLGQVVTLSLPSGPATVKVPGVISYIAPVVDPASGLQEVKATFENGGNKVRPGVAGAMAFGGAE